MIVIEFSAPNVVTLTPTGTLSAADFMQLTTTIDQYINESDGVPNLIIHVGKLPHWNSFRALSEHLHFVRNHQKFVRKIGIVGDNFAVRTLPLLMDLFVSAKVRSFTEARLTEAQQWAADTEDHPGQFEPLEGFPWDVVAIRAKGIITGQDYRDMLIPLVEERLKSHERLKLLFVLDGDFESYSAAAAWDDARFGFSHLRDFAKIALVTDIGWIRHGANTFAPLMKADLRVFAVAELEDAKSWVLR
jgi:hypothetical protein